MGLSVASFLSPRTEVSTDSDVPDESDDPSSPLHAATRATTTARTAAVAPPRLFLTSSTPGSSSPKRDTDHSESRALIRACRELGHRDGHPSPSCYQQACRVHERSCAMRSTHRPEVTRSATRGRYPSG